MLKKTLALVCLTLSLTANAATVYTYTGLEFTSVTGDFDTSDFITATLNLDDALAANLTDVDLTTLAGFSLTMSAGHISIANTGSGVTLSEAEVTTDALGNIVEWGLLLRVAVGATQESNILTRHFPGYNSDLVKDSLTIGAPRGSELGRGNVTPAGTWAVATVPVPAAAWLLGSALIGLAGLKRRK